MLELIYKQLDKTYPIEDGVIYCTKQQHDDVHNVLGPLEVPKSLCKMFFIQWAMERIGPEYKVCGSWDRVNPQTSWFKDGKLHRDGDLPAVESNEGKLYVKHGHTHRLTGPAVISSDGQAYFLMGERVTEREYWDFVKNDAKFLKYLDQWK